MKNKNSFLFYLCLFSILFSFSFLSFGVASAQTVVTSTPTINRTPPATPTYGSYDPFPASDNSFLPCPSGGVSNPLGVTPDPLWLSMCGHCLPTATLYPTLELPAAQPTVVCSTPLAGGQAVCDTPVPVSTAVPYSTVAPVSTSVPVSTAVPVVPRSISCSGGSEKWTCQQLTDNSISFSGSSNWWADPSIFSFYTASGSVFGVINSTSGTHMNYEFTDSSYPSYFSLRYGDPDVYGDQTIIDTLPTEIMADWGGSYDLSILQGSYSFSFIHDVAGSGVGNVWVVDDITRNNKKYALYGDSFLVLSTVPENYVTPTPTAIGGAGSGLGGCDTVNSGLSSLSNQSMSFWTQAGPAACLIIPSFSTVELVDLFSWLDFFFPLMPPGVEQMLQVLFVYLRADTPPATICLQPYEFMPVNLFGTVLLFQTFVDVLLAGFILRHLMSK